MASNSKQLLASIIAITCALFVARATAQPWQVVSVNETFLAGTLKEGTEFAVRVEARKPKEPRDDYFGAADQPGLVVAEIMVKVGGKKASFPAQAFQDLANPLLQTVSVTSQPSGELKLRFTGGQGSPNYEVEYFVQAGRLIKRDVKIFQAAADGTKREVIKTTNF
jgi:hypothetical protein